MTSVNVTSVTNTVTVVEGDTTVVTVTTAGPQGATGTVAAAASGTAAAPGISFISDPNTGIYNPSADNLSFSTGGVQRLSIASDGTINVVGNLTEGGNNVVSVGDTGTVTSTMILDGTILNEDINANAGIVDTKLATIATAGKVSNSATTATNANTASAIVARDGSGNFSAGTITAALTGAASSNVLKAGDTMTGPLLVPAGTAALPGLAVSGDANTGIYSLGADQLAISTGGAGCLFIDASGNVTFGVNGSTSIIAGQSITLARYSGINLHSSWKTSNSSAGLALYQTIGPASGGDSVERLRATISSASGSYQKGLTWQDDSGNLNLGFNAAQGRFEVGNTTIGTGTFTTAPASGTNIAGPNLIIAGGQSTGTGTGGSILFSTASAGGSGTSVNALTERLRITSAGYLGIGTSAPARPLHVTTTENVPFRLTTSNANNYIQFDNSGSTYYIGAKGNSLAFEDSVSERMRIDSSGRLLVGATASTTIYTLEAKVQIVDTAIGISILKANNDAIAVLGNSGTVTSASKLGSLRFAGYDGSSYLYGAWINAEVDGTPGLNSQPGRLIFGTTASGGTLPTERMRIDSAGRVGIGTSAPSLPLDVVGTIRSSTTVTAGSDFRLNNDSFSRIAHSNGSGGFVGGYNVKFATGVKHDSTGNISAVYYDNNGVLRFYTNTSQAADTAGQERLTITAAGLVGIGTSAPDNALHVNGNISFGFRDAATTRSIGYTVTSGAFGGNSGHISFVGNGTGTNIIYRTWSGNHIWQENNAAETMRIDSTGKVGIGTSAPDALLTVNGVGAHGLGSAAAPSFAFTGDLNTGIYSPGADQLAISTGGTTQFFVSATGNIGVGTSTPGSFSTWATAKRLEIKADNTTYGGALLLSNSDNTAASYVYGSVASLDIYNTKAAPITFGTNNTEKLRITSAGNVGIGTSAPTTTLTVGGAPSVLSLTHNFPATNTVGYVFSTIRCGDGFAGREGPVSISAYVADTWGASTAASGLRFGTCPAGGLTATTRMTIDHTGNVGIGTSSPGYVLDVGGAAQTVPTINCFGPAADNNWAGGIRFASNNGTTVTSKIQASTSGLFFEYGGTERARIDSSGRLLVGTSATTGGAVALLQVQGYSGGSTGVGLLELKRGAAVPANGDELGRIDFSSSNSERGAVITTARDGGTWTAGSSYPGRLVFSTTADGAAVPTERMRIDSSGRVLVGATSGFTFKNISPNTGISQQQLVGLGNDETASFAIVHCNQGGIGRGPSLMLAKNRSGSTALGTVSVGENLGEVSFHGSAASAFVPAAAISCNQDGGTPSSTSMAGRLVFSTTASGAATSTERMRIDSAGRVLVGTATANTSGAKLQTVDGITFPATQVASADPNTLDDYEEGTFTPTVAGSSTVGTATYAVQSARYSKIGRVVHFEIYINWSAGTGTGNLQITGLPFTSSNTQTYPGVNIGFISDVALSANNYATAQVDNKANTVRLKQSPVGGGTATDVAYDANAALTLSGSYTV
jgi:hypothetical protein